MKKILAVVVSFALLAVLFSGLAVSSHAFDEYYDYVTFTATGNDPYAVFKFGSSGANQKIDPDLVSWAVIRYRTISKTDTEGMPYKGQLYIMPFAEPYIPITYKFSGQWETVVVDVTMVSDETGLDSKWDSAFYTSKTLIRFDPLESSRDAESPDDDYDAQVEEGASIDIAWICFFEKEEDARAYTGRESTPYCVLGPGALSKLRDPVNNLTVERHKIDTPEPGQETPTPSPTPEPTPTPEATPTSEPTPTLEPTNVPTFAPTAKPTNPPKNDTGRDNSSSGKGGCGGIIGGGIALAAMAAAAFAVRKKR